ncbi:MAG: sugar ABC transporter permease [Bacillota bacterium]|nr:sugar ABC transporter permease [Bacillota bacterium]
MKKPITIETRRKIEGLAFISLWVIGLVLFWIYPLIYSFLMSLNEVTIMTDRLQFKFIGLTNFKKALFQDADIPNTFIQFIQQSIVIIPIIVVFALVIALLLNQKLKGRGIIRGIFFLPVVLTSGNLINELAGQKQGSINFLVSVTSNNMFSFLGPTWETTINNILANFLIILWYSGIQMLILIAGMQSISPSIYEAAKIDGANGWEIFWKITLPGITPFIFISVVYTIVDQFTLTSNPILTLVNDKIFNSNTGFGYASAISWIYFGVILLFLAFSFMIFRKSLKLTRK